MALNPKRRHMVIQVAVNEEEDTIIKKNAESASRPPSTWLREMGLGKTELKKHRWSLVTRNEGGIYPFVNHGPEYLFPKFRNEEIALGSWEVREEKDGEIALGSYANLEWRAYCDFTIRPWSLYPHPVTEKSHACTTDEVTQSQVQEGLVMWPSLLVHANLQRSVWMAVSGWAGELRTLLVYNGPVTGEPLSHRNPKVQMILEYNIDSDCLEYDKEPLEELE